MVLILKKRAVVEYITTLSNYLLSWFKIRMMFKSINKADIFKNILDKKINDAKFFKILHIINELNFLFSRFIILIIVLIPFLGQFFHQKTALFIIGKMIFKNLLVFIPVIILTYLISYFTHRFFNSIIIKLNETN